MENKHKLRIEKFSRRDWKINVPLPEEGWGGSKGETQKCPFDNKYKHFPAYMSNG